MSEWQDKLQNEAEIELDALLDLNRAIREEERVKKSTSRNLASAVINSHQVNANYNLEAQLKAIDELYRKGFAKVIVLNDGSDNLTRYRITQANKSLIKTVDGKVINVINRLAALASQLITAELDDEIEVNGRRIGYVEHISFIHKNAFKDDEIELLELIESEEDFVTRTKKQFHISKPSKLSEGVAEVSGSYNIPNTPLSEDSQELAPDSLQSLSSDFYTNTTREQEELIKLPNRGAIAVMGVAGSGKTSIALGRVKKFYSSNQFDEEHEDFDGFFRDPSKMVGFVLHKQLVPYLKETCTELELANMPVREYKELQKILLTHFQVLLQLKMSSGGKFTRTGSAFVFPEQCRLSWLKQVERSVTGQLIDDVLKSLANVEEAIRQQFLQRHNLPNSISSIEPLICSAWREFYEDVKLKLTKRRETPGKWGFFSIELVNFFNQLAEVWSSKISSEKQYFEKDGYLTSKRHDPMATPIYPFSTKDKDSKTAETLNKLKSTLSAKVRSAFFLSDSGAKLKVTDKYVKFLAKLASQSEMNPEIQELYETVSLGKLSNADLDLLTIVSDLLCWKTGLNAFIPRYLKERPKYTSVFIDEVQDFTELQVLSMALQADPKRSAITVVGDFKQQLYTDKVQDLNECLPMMQSKRPFRLTRNMRQHPVLARYSSYIRSILSGDNVDETQVNFTSTELVKKQVKHNDIESQIIEFIRDAGQNKSVCVICPTHEIAQTLESKLSIIIETELWRESHVSENSTELNKSFYIHFTTPKPTKGLEFDRVVIPHFEMMSMNDSVDGHHTYVAVSRPRERLLLLEEMS